MADNSFFDESRDQSLVKAEIVAKYFWAWARVIIPSVKKYRGYITYIDLFSGPGRYKNGSKSTPLLILERAIEDPEISCLLQTIFNDINTDNSNSLQKAINSLPNIEKLQYQPVVLNLEVGEKLVQRLEKAKLKATLFFIDPWGYKGLSIRLLGSVIKEWGCDCIFFFNYNRINMGLGNSAVSQHMEALFGREQADELKERLKDLEPNERELSIVEAIAEALKEVGGEYVLPFRFISSQRDSTSHHLILVTKHEKGYEIMKEIMAKESSDKHEGIPSFEYNPATSKQLILFELTRPLEELGEMLLTEFAAQKMTLFEVYKCHHVGKKYIKKNYQEILKQLENQGKIVANPPASKRRKGTFADKVTITFPLKQTV